VKHIDVTRTPASSRSSRRCSTWRSARATCTAHPTSTTAC
jgi:hypothetical protein